MDKKTSYIQQKAKVLSDIELKGEQKRYKKLTKHIATILSVAAVLLLIILYAYSIGYYRVYNIPPSYFNLDLKMYLPVALQSCAFFLLFSYYYASRKKDKVLNKNRIDLVRIFWVTFAIERLFSLNNVNGILYIVFACSIAIAIELITFFRRQPKKDKTISGLIYHMKLENMIERNFLYSLYKRGYILVIIFLVLIAPSWGRLKAEHKVDYETVFVENQVYAIIIDYGDAVVLQSCSINNDTLTIDTSHYLYKSKEDMVISYSKYGEVILK